MAKRCCAVTQGRSIVDHSDNQGIGALGEETESTPREVPLHPGSAHWFREHGFKV